MDGAVLVGLIPLLLMLAAAAWGFLYLPPGARIPLDFHFGLNRADRWMGKTLGLLIYPGIGILVAAFELVVAATSGAGSKSVAVPMAVILLILLAIQVLALRRARAAARP
ncbi:MAG: hypothetical protein M0027_05670 [Candidatus Dormibacteraeota bacterium]|jgi:hypothetical protein|nr:hypothetical protein [Candidatus Dormibacteraeota bacterium]